MSALTSKEKTHVRICITPQLMSPFFPPRFNDSSSTTLIRKQQRITSQSTSILTDRRQAWNMVTCNSAFTDWEGFVCEPVSEFSPFL